MQSHGAQIINSNISFYIPLKDIIKLQLALRTNKIPEDPFDIDEISDEQVSNVFENPFKLDAKTRNFVLLMMELNDSYDRAGVIPTVNAPALAEDAYGLTGNRYRELKSDKARRKAIEWCLEKNREYMHFLTKLFEFLGTVDSQLESLQERLKKKAENASDGERRILKPVIDKIRQTRRKISDHKQSLQQSNLPDMQELEHIQHDVTENVAEVQQTVSRAQRFMMRMQKAKQAFGKVGLGLKAVAARYGLKKFTPQNVNNSNGPDDDNDDPDTGSEADLNEEKNRRRRTPPPEFNVA